MQLPAKDDQLNREKCPSVQKEKHPDLTITPEKNNKLLC